MSGLSPRLPIFSPTVISFQNSGYPNKLSGRRQRHQIKTATNINTPPSPHSPLPTLVLGSTGGLFLPMVCSHIRFCKFCIVDRLDAGYCHVVVSAHCIITRPGSRQTNKIKLHLCNNTINTGPGPGRHRKTQSAETRITLTRAWSSASRHSKHQVSCLANFRVETKRKQM